MPVLREAAESDLNAVFALICELERHGDEKMELSAFTPVYLKNLRDENIVYLLAEEEGRIVGFGSLHLQSLLHHCGLIAEVQELMVAEGCRGRGIGAMLLNALEAEAARRGCRQVELCCNRKRVESNKFYGRRGYVKSHYKHTKKLGRREEP